jgi:uncharacterized repeat protein (TIGR03803 family)
MLTFSAYGKGAPSPSGPTETILHSFTGYATGDGSEPRGQMARDPGGNLYSTTQLGGRNAYHNTTGGDGSVFMVAPSGAETDIYDFGSGVDGWSPMGGVITDGVNLYGTTRYGGSSNNGMVFELSPSGTGGWNEIPLWSFGGTAANDGSNPFAALMVDDSNNLYGTTSSGGEYGNGTVFELSPDGSGGYSEAVLYSFGAVAGDGGDPVGTPIMDGSGNLYGTTFQGGTGNAGTVFELSPNPDGSWTRKILYSFGNLPDGALPGSLIMYAGNLYGTTASGGANFNALNPGGTAFKLTKSGQQWTESIIWNFGKKSGKANDGEEPNGIISDTKGNLYGVTSAGGAFDGTAFKLTPPSKIGSSWTETILHNFLGGADGRIPECTMVFDLSGNLYGTTYAGGGTVAPAGVGTVFKITP